MSSSQPPVSSQDPQTQALKASLWFAIGKIVDEETLRLDTGSTPQFIGALTEMVWAQIENISQDLTSFSHHANRTTVTTDDVLLIARRNDALHGIMQEFVDAQKAGKASNKKGAAGKGMVRAGAGKR